MQRILQPLPPFNSAPTAGTSPVLTVPHRGRSFTHINLRVIGSGPSSAVLDVRNVVTSIEVLINDKPVSIYLPKLWQQYVGYMNQNGDTPAVDMISIPFESPGVRGSELGTADIETLQVRVNVVAALPASTTFTGVDASAGYFLESVPRAEAFVHRIITPKMTAVGENVFSNLDFGSIVKLRRLFLMCLPATADLAVTGALNANTAITRCRIKVGDLPVWDAKSQDVNFVLNQSPLYKIPGTQYGHFIPLDLNLNSDDFQVIKLGDTRLPFELVVDWDAAVTAAFAQILHYLTPGRPAKSALAVGEFWYAKDNNGGGHAINVACCGLEPSDVVFYEPQTRKVVTLTATEKFSCTMVRF